MNELTPKQVVEALDRHIVGQDDAKRAVAIAVRNRWRRQQLPEALRQEIGPSNITSLEFSRNYLRKLILTQSGMPYCSVQIEGLIVPNRAPRAWVPIGRRLNQTPLRALGFYLRGVATRTKLTTHA